ncbi:transcriptional regulator [Paucibacter sp. JuS9]|uniref:winged helix-turn-helix domain-containing protein n=1 Tax=Paucibacter sp. JuS9 TaxID=3228748 RepID=UPI0037572B6A
MSSAASPPSVHSFDHFVLDAGQRSLCRGGEPVALNARYFDALALLVREHGRLVGKQRFFDEVWAGSVVTDAALTQCIKEIRRALGDDASAPRFVRTVPGHGYIFIAEMQTAKAAEAASVTEAAGVPAPLLPDTHAAAGGSVFAAELVSAVLGGAVSGLLGGLLYGSALAFSPQALGVGSVSVLGVLLALCIFVGVAGAFGVGLGLAAARRWTRGPGWQLAGGALGGFVVGGLTKLLGSDTFTLLVGHAPAGTTGGLEGAVIGFAVVAGWLLGGAGEAANIRRPVLCAAFTTGLAGALLPLAGGSMMARSLDRMAASFDSSRLDLGPLARLFGEAQLGPISQSALGMMEGALFGACFAGVIWAGRRRMARPAPQTGAQVAM